MERKVYLIDTNIFLEVLFSQEKSASCLKLLQKIADGKLRGIVSSFSIFSIGLISHRKHVSELQFEKFLLDLDKIEGLEILNPPVSSIIETYKMIGATGLDFDDSLHFHIAKALDIPIITLDKDFKKVAVLSFTPAEVL